MAPSWLDQLGEDGDQLAVMASPEYNPFLQSPAPNAVPDPTAKPASAAAGESPNTTSAATLPTTARTAAKPAAIGITPGNGRGSPAGSAAAVLGESNAIGGPGKRLGFPQFAAGSLKPAGGSGGLADDSALLCYCIAAPHLWIPFRPGRCPRMHLRACTIVRPPLWPRTRPLTRRLHAGAASAIRLGEPSTLAAASSDPVPSLAQISARAECSPPTRRARCGVHSRCPSCPLRAVMVTAKTPSGPGDDSPTQARASCKSPLNPPPFHS